VNIIDNDGGDGTGISFDNNNITVNEADGTATIDVILSGSVQDGFTLDFTTNDGSAVQPDDYTTVSGTLTFDGNDGEIQSITVPITDDNLIEVTENFVVDLSNLSTDLIGINEAQANVNIIDNDGGDGTGISFDNTDVIVNEDAGTATFIVTLSGAVQGGFTLDYSSTNGTAVEPNDYTAVSGTLTFAGTDGETQSIVVPIIDDLLIEPTEGYAINLSNLSTDLISINTPQANGGILDNDAMDGVTGISFENTEIDVIESAGTATFIVRLTGDVQGGFTLDYASADGSAVQVDDYTAVSGTLTFTGNDGESYEIVVPITDDLIIETNEGYVINLSNLSTDLIQINTPQANGGIIDDDLKDIMVSDYTVEFMIFCGEEIPEVPELTFSNGCGDYQVEFIEEEQASETTDDFIIVRTWNVTDACNNTATFEQIIMVMQLEKEVITIDICIEDEAIDLTSYLPEGFDTNGDFTVTEGIGNMDGSFFTPSDFELGAYIISYVAEDGSCTFLADFNITVNADCVDCSQDQIVISAALTPNGDGVNDVFGISGAEFCFFEYDVMIFNRWGDKVYEQKNYQNTWNGFSPSGSIGSSGVLPAGTYYYIIIVANKTDFEPINGYFYLGTD
jgi:gliding motility-associated-like protein